MTARTRVTNQGSFNTLCRVLIGCYSSRALPLLAEPSTFQYPLSGLDRLLQSDIVVPPDALEVSIPSVGS